LHTRTEAIELSVSAVGRSLLMFVSASPHLNCGMSGLPQPLPSGARLGKACAPCHRRKIRCDGALPTCGSCHRAKDDGCDVADGVLWPHERVQQLEERVKWLEELVDKSYEGFARSVVTGTEMSLRPAPPHPPEQFAEEVGLLSSPGLRFV
jgi:hypothetical protein